jgi:hypothetical protein
MILEKNYLGIYVLKNEPGELPTMTFVLMNLEDMIETYNLIQEELKKAKILF